MKTFKDLEFRDHPTGFAKKQARLEFKNGYEVSVISGGFSYTDGPDEYELAILKNGYLCYDTPLSDDVLGHLSSRQVTNYMKKIQLLKKKRTKK